MTTVPSGKVRRILNHVHEVREIADHQSRMTHAIASACGVIGADVGALFVFASPAAPVPQAGLIHGYSPGQTQAVLAEYATRSVDFDLVAARLRSEFRGAGHVLARRRRDLLGDRDWYNSSFLNETRRRWGVDDCIYSLQGIGSASFGLGINRSFGSRPFSDADRGLIEVFNLAIAATALECLLPHAPSANESRRDALPPRVRQVLEGLLRGDSNRQIAEQLGISPNTVKCHCEVVFRTFGVRSRSEFVAGWFANR